LDNLTYPGFLLWKNNVLLSIVRMVPFLLSPDGLLADEGWEGTINILQNAAQSEETKERFFNLSSF